VLEKMGRVGTSSSLSILVGSGDVVLRHSLSAAGNYGVGQLIWVDTLPRGAG
jgi:hypothetical protein